MGLGIEGLSEEKSKEMLEAAKPLIKWINKNCNPHSMAVVNTIGVELFSAEANATTEDFLED